MKLGEINYLVQLGGVAGIFYISEASFEAFEALSSQKGIKIWFKFDFENYSGKGLRS